MPDAVNHTVVNSNDLLTHDVIIFFWFSQKQSNQRRYDTTYKHPEHARNCERN
jgi:hypothetical protein